MNCSRSLPVSLPTKQPNHCIRKCHNNLPHHIQSITPCRTSICCRTGRDICSDEDRIHQSGRVMFTQVSSDQIVSVCNSTYRVLACTIYIQFKPNSTPKAKKKKKKKEKHTTSPQIPIPSNPNRIIPIRLRKPPPHLRNQQPRRRNFPPLHNPSVPDNICSGADTQDRRVRGEMAAHEVEVFFCWWHSFWRGTGD